MFSPTTADRVTIGFYGTEEDIKNSYNALISELSNIRNIKQHLYRAADKFKQNQPEIVLSILIKPNWEKNSNFNEPTYEVIKNDFIAKLKLCIDEDKDLEGVVVEDVYCKLEREEQAYLQKLEAKGCIADMIKNHAIICKDNANRRHLQMDSNTKVYNFEALYRETFASQQQADALNASYYDHRNKYISAHNKIVYTTPAGKIASVLRRIHLDYCQKHHDDHIKSFALSELRMEEFEALKHLLSSKSLKFPDIGVEKENYKKIYFTHIQSEDIINALGEGKSDHVEIQKIIDNLLAQRQDHNKIQKSLETLEKTEHDRSKILRIKLAYYLKIDKLEQREKNSIYSKDFVVALQEIGLTVKRTIRQGMSNKDIYLADICDPAFRITMFIVTAVNMSWSGINTALSELKNLQSIRTGDAEYDYQCYHNAVAKHIDELRHYPNNSSSQLEHEQLMKISNEKLEQTMMKDFVINVAIKHFDMLHPVIRRMLPTSAGGKRLFKEVFKCDVEQFNEAATDYKMQRIFPKIILSALFYGILSLQLFLSYLTKSDEYDLSLKLIMALIFFISICYLGMHEIVHMKNNNRFRLFQSSYESQLPAITDNSVKKEIEKRENYSIS